MKENNRFLQLIVIVYVNEVRYNTAVTCKKMFSFIIITWGLGIKASGDEEINSFQNILREISLTL